VRLLLLVYSLCTRGALRSFFNKIAITYPKKIKSRFTYIYIYIYIYMYKLKKNIKTKKCKNKRYKQKTHKCKATSFGLSLYSIPVISIQFSHILNLYFP
jgi:H+/gluconate symporter-like permease